MALYLLKLREVLLAAAHLVENSDNDHKGFPLGAKGNAACQELKQSAFLLSSWAISAKAQTFND
jgi:hypothetical protein